MFKNEILFHFRGEPWTVAAVCLVLGGICLIAWVVLLPIAARYSGTVRQLSTREAADFTFAGTDRSYVKPRPQVYGPAAGREWRINISIGDLRAAWQQQRYGVFFGVSGLMLFGLTSFGLFGISLMLFTEDAMIGWLACGPVLLLMLLYLFMMWAAIYTKLE